MWVVFPKEYKLERQNKDDMCLQQLVLLTDRRGFHKVYFLCWFGGFFVVIKWLAGMILFYAGYLQFQKLLSFLESKQDFVYCALRASEILLELEGQPVSGRW